MDEDADGAPLPRRARPAANATRRAASDPKLASRTLEAFPAHAMMDPAIGEARPLPC